MQVAAVVGHQGLCSTAGERVERHPGVSASSCCAVRATRPSGILARRCPHAYEPFEVEDALDRKADRGARRSDGLLLSVPPSGQVLAQVA
jgi:hypothetical protein